MPAVRTRRPAGLIGFTDHGRGGHDGRALVAALLLTTDFHDHLGRPLAAEALTATTFIFREEGIERRFSGRDDLICLRLMV